MSYLALFKLAVPETILVIGVLVVLFADFTMRELELRFRFVIGGMIVGIRLAIIDFPEPGGPSIRRLCAPATATSIARLT